WVLGAVPRTPSAPWDPTAAGAADAARGQRRKVRGVPPRGGLRRSREPRRATGLLPHGRGAVLGDRVVHGGAHPADVSPAASGRAFQGGVSGGGSGVRDGARHLGGLAGRVLSGAETRSGGKCLSGRTSRSPDPARMQAF